MSPVTFRRHLSSEGAAWSLGLLIAGSLAFVWPLLRSWEKAPSGGFIIGGLLPFSDATNWLTGGFYFLDHGVLDSFNTRRPFNAGFLALKLLMTGENYQATLFIQALLTGFACALAALVVSRSLGRLAGLLFLALLWAYAGRYVPTPLTENLGLTLGAAGFAVSWVAVERRRFGLFAVGLAILTLALNARAGAMFILPALVVWGGFAFRAVGGGRLKPWALGAAAVGLGLLANLMLVWVFGSNDNVAFSNFALTAYGLAVGGKRWVQFYEDHPEIQDFTTEGAAAAYIYKLTFQEILKHPLGLAIGLWKGLASYDGLFGFILSRRYRLLPEMFAWGGALWCLMPKGREPRLVFVWVGLLATFASIPFIFADAGQRVLAATMPFQAAAAAAGLSLALRQCGPWLGWAANSAVQAGPSRGAVIGACALAAVITGSPYAVSFLLRPPAPRFAAESCSGGLVPIIGRLGHSAPYLHLIAEGRTRVPEVWLDRFRRPKFDAIRIRSILRKMEAGETVAWVFDRGGQVESPVWVLADAGLTPAPGQWVQFCGEAIADDVAKSFRMYRARSAHPVSPF